MSDDKKLHITIPDGLDFADPHLSRDRTDGSLHFDWAPIEKICAASGLDVGIFKNSPEDNVAGLIVAWYFRHRELGGAIDPVQQELIEEMIAEDAYGSGLSHPPGQA